MPDATTADAASADAAQADADPADAKPAPERKRREQEDCPALFTMRSPSLHARLAGLAARLWRGLSDIVDERRCAVCHTPFPPPAQADAVSARLLCPACAQRLSPYAGSACPLCGRPSLAASPPGIPCGACLVAPPPWRALAFYGLYDGPLRDALLRFKFGGEFSLVPLLGGMLDMAARPLPPCDAVIPIPRHPLRLRARGFNQMQELARVLATQRNTPLGNGLLVRIRSTEPQAGLSARQRRHNPQGSFAARDVAGMRLLLADDIVTTGSTLRHAAATLLNAGAAAVDVAVVAVAAPRPLDKVTAFV